MNTGVAPPGTNEGRMEVKEACASYVVEAGLRVPEGYKQTEVGVIPEDWGVSTVGAEFSIQLGKMLDAEKNVGVPKPFLGNRAVQWGRIDLDDIGEIKLTLSDLKRFRLRDGDLLVCEGGDIGRAAIWRQPIEECYFQKALHRLRPIRGYNRSLMLNMLQRLAFTGFLLNFVTQTSIAHLPKDKFQTVPIPLPPTKAEQEAIAEALSDADALIESLEQLLAKKRQIKQGAMQELLTGKKRLPGFGGEWEVTRLGECLFERPDYGINAAGVEYSDQLPTYIRITDITDDGRFKPEPLVSVEHSDSAHYYLSEGDLVIARTGASVGKSYLYRQADGDLVFAGFLIRVRPDSSKLLPIFLFNFVQSKTYWNWVRLMSMRSGQPGINGNEFTVLPLTIPGIEEQTAIATLLTDMDAELVALEAKLAKARQIKQGMMQELLTGRIRLI
jgi:type I restriction enzyme S subunit